MDQAYAAIGKAVLAAQVFETVFICIFEAFKMKTEPGYLEKTSGYVDAGAFKIPVKNVVNTLAARGNIATDLETRLTAYVDDRNMLVHRWFQQHGRPADGDAEGFAPLVELANRVEREALGLTRQLAGYMVKFAEPEWARANGEEYGNRMAVIFHRAHIEN